MTCEEFDRVTSASPEAATNAELMAITTHALECKECRVKLRVSARTARSRMTPKERRREDLMALRIAKRVARDPEFYL